jgi:hypothetical protein
MRIGRKAILGAVIAATTTGTMLVAAPHAFAAPGNCTISYPGNSTVTSLCTSGTGYQAIDVVMYMYGDGYTAAVGNCAPVGQVSSTRIPWPDIISVSIFTSCNQ